MTLPTPPAVHGRLRSTVVEVTGDDRLSYLDAVLSQRLRDVAAGTATSALELGPHGEPTGVLDLAVLDDRVLLLVPDGQTDEVLERLRTRTFLADARFEPLVDALPLRVRGDCAAALAALGVDPNPGTTTERDGLLWLRWRHGADAVGTADAIDRVEAALEDEGSTAADTATLDAAEVAAGVPRAPEEITRGRLPEELGLLPTHVHLDKGCYPGQEAVARMWMLGRPRRHLAVVRLPTGTRPGHVDDDLAAVEVTRTATVGDTTVGLAFVKRGTEKGDTPHPGVEVLELVGADLPVPGHDPAMTRRRDR